jgi:hypothetical protein
MTNSAIPTASLAPVITTEGGLPYIHPALQSILNNLEKAAPTLYAEVNVAILASPNLMMSLTRRLSCQPGYRAAVVSCG